MGKSKDDNVKRIRITEKRGKGEPESKQFSAEEKREE